MALHGMQGTPYIYQGEEIGMTNPHFTRITDYRDVESHNMFAALRAAGRDPDELLAIPPVNPATTAARQCSGTTVKRRFHRGEPWINLCDNYAEVNVAAALRDENSVFYTYQKLIALRKTQPVLIWGDYQDLLPDSPSVWCYRRQWQGQTLLVVANLSDQCQEWHPPHIKDSGRRYCTIMARSPASQPR